MLDEGEADRFSPRSYTAHSYTRYQFRLASVCFVFTWVYFSAKLPLLFYCFCADLLKVATKSWPKKKKKKTLFVQSKDTKLKLNYTHSNCGIKIKKWVNELGL